MTSVAHAAPLSGLVALLLGAGQSSWAQSPASVVEERTPATHPIHYFISLPQGWTRDRAWPVAVVIPDAYREFENTARLFGAARGSLPFIVVVPLVLSGGGTARQHMGDFDYTAAVWTFADSVGNCRFDDDGMTAVLRDVREKYGASENVFIAGWEAGGHVVLAQLFDHPERFRAVVAVTPNFQARCVTAARGASQAAATIPVRGFHGANDAGWAAGQPLYSQWPRVDSVARARGFTNVADTLIPGQGHGPMPADVFRFFASLLGK
jgi:dienelactone hydrolase